MIQSIEQVYAQALLDLADEVGQLDVVGNEMMQLGELVREQPDLVRLISSRTLSVEQRGRIVENMFQGRVSDLVYRFIQVLNAKNRLDHILGIVKAVARGVDERHGIVRVKAFLAAALETQWAQQVAERIGTVVGGQVQLEQQVQPELIGGLKIRVRDRLIDGSVSTQLRLMRQRIVVSGCDDARQKIEKLMTQ
jgi:F-type H+-transporting ATPase subunit delta